MLAAELMSSPVYAVGRDATIAEAAKLMLLNRIGSVVVLDENGHYAGLLTERMIMPEEVTVPFMRGKTFRLLGQEIGDFEYVEEAMEKARSMKVSEVANERQKPVGPDARIADIVEEMATSNIHHVCVVEDRKPVGMVSRHDLLRLFFDLDSPSKRDADSNRS